MGRIKAVARKEFLHIMRDRRTLMLIVLMPVMQLTIYGYAINTDVKHLATAVYDEDQTPLSRRLIQKHLPQHPIIKPMPRFTNLKMPNNIMPSEINIPDKI